MYQVVYGGIAVRFSVFNCCYFKVFVDVPTPKLGWPLTLYFVQLAAFTRLKILWLNKWFRWQELTLQVENSQDRFKVKWCHATVE